MRKLAALLIFLMIVLVAASRCMAAEEDLVTQVAAGPGGIDYCRPDFRCFGRCFKPGKCNKCCENLGYPNDHGRCDGLACYCCIA